MSFVGFGGFGGGVEGLGLREGAVGRKSATARVQGQCTAAASLDQGGDVCDSPMSIFKKSTTVCPRSRMMVSYSLNLWG